MSANFVYGYHAVWAILEHQPRRAQKLLVARKDSDEIIALARKSGVTIELVDRAYLDKKFGAGSEAQGLVLQCSAFNYLDLDGLLKLNPQKILVLDSWQDPVNLGRAARACVSFGCDGMIILKDRAAQVNNSAEKAAVGAFARLPVARVGNLSSALNILKKQNYFVYGADEHGEVILSKCDFASKAVIVIGQEGDGLRDLTKKQCDMLVNIPMKNNNICLNAADTALIFLYELSKGD